LRATTGHPFWVTGRGWVPAAELATSEVLWSPSGEPIHLASSPSNELTYETVYNFDVAEYHTYFVGHHGVWVHNAGPSPPNGGAPIPCQNQANTDPAAPAGIAAKTKWKGFSAGQLSIHFQKHVVDGEEFGNITQNEYLRRAKAFAAETSTGFQEEQVGPFVVKYDPSTRRVLIGNTTSRELRTFYIADDRDLDPFEAAKQTARDKAGL
jgi:hypothetical protein